MPNANTFLKTKFRTFVKVLKLRKGRFSKTLNDVMSLAELMAFNLFCFKENAHQQQSISKKTLKPHKRYPCCVCLFAFKQSGHRKDHYARIHQIFPKGKKEKADKKVTAAETKAIAPDNIEEMISPTLDLAADVPLESKTKETVKKRGRKKRVDQMMETSNGTIESVPAEKSKEAPTEKETLPEPPVLPILNPVPEPEKKRVVICRKSTFKRAQTTKRTSKPLKIFPPKLSLLKKQKAVISPNLLERLQRVEQKFSSPDAIKEISSEGSSRKMISHVPTRGCVISITDIFRDVPKNEDIFRLISPKVILKRVDQNTFDPPFQVY